MDSFNEENIALSCGYCGAAFGTWGIIIKDNLLEDHECLKHSQNVNVNYALGLIFNSHIEEQENILPPTLSRNASKSDLWTDDAVKLLIDNYKLNKEKFASPCFTKKKVWEMISAEINKYGYNKTGVRCDEKWRNLKKNFVKVRTEMNKTGNSRITWKFYEDFQEIYWKDPQFIPIATASSSGMSTHASTSGTSSPVSISGMNASASTSGMSTHASTSATSIHEKFSISNRSMEHKKNLSPGEKINKRLFRTSDIELRREKRHEEKMKLKREMFEWYKANFNKKQ